jgi:hypothetical protein
MAHIRVGHLSPNAPAVDVALAGGDVLFANAAFQDVADYIPVPAVLIIWKSAWQERTM